MKVRTTLTFTGRVPKIPHMEIDYLQTLPVAVTIRQGNFDQLFVEGKRKGRVHRVTEEGDYFSTDANDVNGFMVSETIIECTLEL